MWNYSLEIILAFVGEKYIYSTLLSRWKCAPQGERVSCDFTWMCQTSHVANRKSIAFPIEHIGFLIDLIVVISEVSWDLFKGVFKDDFKMAAKTSCI